MEAWTAAQTAEWLTGRGMRLGAGATVSFAAGDRESVSIAIPAEGLRIVALAVVLTKHLEQDSGIESLFWRRRHGMWSEDFEAIGDAIHGGLTSCLATDAAPFAIRTAGGDLVARQALLATSMLFQWDAVLVPAHGRWFVAVDHHGRASIEAATAGDRDVVAAAMHAWSPRNSSQGGSSG